MAVLSHLIHRIKLNHRESAYYSDHTNISPDARSFVLVWEHASCLDDVRDTLSASGANTVEFSSLQSRAARYRHQHNVPLQKLYVSPSKTQWEDLAQLARQIKAEKEEESITKEITE